MNELCTLIDNLRRGESTTLSLYDDCIRKHEPEGQVSVCAEWTGWAELFFDGDSLLEALRKADAARRKEVNA